MYKNILITLIFPLALSATTVNITMPKVPEVPKVEAVAPQIKVHTDKNYKTNEQIMKEATQEKVVHFSNHVAPNIKEKKDTSDKVYLVGDVKDSKVTAYLHAPLLPVSDVKQILEEAGFEVLKTYKVDKKGSIYSIIFTNPSLTKLASKDTRGFAGSLRVTVDKNNELISITNPIYIMAAFMQNEYDEAVAKKTLTELRDAFKNLENSDETLKFRLLPRYQFMKGMPKYQDMKVIKKLSSQKLLENARKSKKIVYEQKLLNGATIIGVKLSKRTSKFIKKVGYQNAGLLPYPVLIEKGEAKILDPKYYIAIMYPMLKMSQFMKISTVPGAIHKDIDKIFR